MFKKISKVLLFIYTLVFISVSFAGDFNNSGIFESNKLYFSANRIINDGQLIGRQSVYLESNELLGVGLIKSPFITIKAKTFNFTGTIECLSYCEIHSENSFNQYLFTKAGKGEIKIFINGILKDY